MTKSKRLIMSVMFCFFYSVFCLGDENEDNIGYFPPNGFVPDEKTAMTIAEAIWIPIYGDKIRKNKPFIARLENDIWYIEGSFKKTILPSAGGVPYIEIDKKTGQILKVYHSK